MYSINCGKKISKYFIIYNCIFNRKKFSLVHSFLEVEIRRYVFLCVAVNKKKKKKEIRGVGKDIVIQPWSGIVAIEGHLQFERVV